MSCPSLELFLKYAHKFNAVTIDPDKEKNMRFNVWNVTPADVHKLITSNSSQNLPGRDESKYVLAKIDNALKRIGASNKSAEQFVTDIIDPESVNKAIAIHEVMEAVKGEADKARNNDIDIAEIEVEGILPALPLSRVAASIGRKILYTEQIRFKSQEESPKIAAEIEQLYYTQGLIALRELEEKGYVNLHEDQPTIRDYTDSEAATGQFSGGTKVVNNVRSVSLNTAKMGITKNKDNSDTLTPEAAFFLNRTASNLDGTELGVVVDTLTAVRHVTQASSTVLPDIGQADKDRKLSDGDPEGNVQDPTTERARQKLYDNPLYVNTSVHKFLEVLRQATADTENGESSAVKVISEAFKGSPLKLNSLFGIKNSLNYSIDRKESIAGQNLSKTVPLDDIVDIYDVLTDSDGNPASLHMALKGGRNQRLYYENSILNAHASKQSRHMLTAGEQTIEVGSPDFNRIVYAMAEALGDSDLTHAEIVNGGNAKLDKAIKLYNKFDKATDMGLKVAALSGLPAVYPGVDFAALLTTLSGINDVQTRGKDATHITTEFMDSADATAQGGTLTFQQALTTNTNVQTFMERIGIMKTEDGSIVSDATKLNDIYGLMSEGITNFVRDEDTRTVAIDTKGDIRETLQTTLNLLFGGDAKGERDLSKEATMPFIYGQGEAGATTSMSDSIAKRIIDNLEDKTTREYLAVLLDDKSMVSKSPKKLNDTAGLYANIKDSLKSKGIPAQLYAIMEAEINKVYLKEFKSDSKAVYELAQQVNNNHNMKVLPLGAVLDGISIDQVEKYGMPLTKIVEVSSKVTGESSDPLIREGGHTVLTRKQQLFKSIMDVSVIHGADSGLMYHAVDKSVGNTGAVIVHDQVISSVEAVRKVEEEYVKLNARLVAEYDTHQQVMKSIEHYDPELAKTPKYIKLRAKLDARLAAKAKMVADGRLNESTDALIGDGNKYEQFANPAAKPKEEIQDDLSFNSEDNKLFAGRSTEDNRSGTNQTELLRTFAADSPLIAKFLDSAVNPAVSGSNNFFNTETDQVVISGTDQGRDDGIVKRLTGKNRKLQMELIEHEIVHHNTAAYIAKAMNDKDNSADTEAVRDVFYFQQAIKAIGKFIATNYNTVNGTKVFDDLGPEVFDRMSYITNSKLTPAAQVAEFVAIMTTEPEVADVIYKTIAGRVPTKKLKQRIKDFVNRVSSALLGLSNKDFMKATDADKLQAALVRTLENGRSYKEEQRSEAIAHQKGFNTLHAGINPSSTVRYLNSTVASIVTSRMESNGKILLGSLHENAKRVFPLYSDVSASLRGAYESSEAMQQLVHTITGEGTNKSAKADLLAMSAKIESDQRASIAFQHQEFKKALKGVDDKTRATIGRFVTQLPLHDYFVEHSHITTAAELDAEVTRLEAEVAKVNKTAVKDVNDLIDRNVHGIEGGMLYNLATKYKSGKDDKHGSNVRSLLALKSIQAVGSKDFEKFLANTDLANLVKDNVIANKISLMAVGGTEGMRDSLIPDYWKESPQIKAVSLSDLGGYERGEETGWKVLREPTRTTLGVVYKELVDSTELQGAHTDISLQSTDINVESKQHKKFSNVVNAGGDKVKLVLTQKEKEQMGLETDFVDTLIRGTAHSMAVQESQAIRDAIVVSENRFDATTEDKLGDLKSVLKSSNVDAPWFVKLGEDQTYSSLDPAVRAKYKVVGGRASNIVGAGGTRFSDEVHLVRKDMSHLLIGAHSSSLFQNKKMKWATRIVKDIMAGTKIGMVVLNPVKIAIDNVSNLSYLSVAGASPLFIAKQYKEISRDYHKYQNLVHEAVQYKVRLAANPDDTAAKKALAKLHERIADNPVGDLAHKGFVNSLGSDLVARSSDVSSGLQSDMETALTYLLKNKKGNKNIVGHFIQRLHQIGFQSEDYVKYLGGIVGKAKDGKSMEQQLDLAVDRIRDIKSEGDIVSYVSQYTTSPGSELVRAGSSMTDLTDVLAKETLYRHAIQNEGMTEEAARIHVLDSFPDYKENLPLSVKQLSDVGIIMFPSFWLRIQKAIYRLAKDKPVGLSTELIVESYVTGNVSTIFDANIINKSESFGGLFHLPLDSAGIGSVIPQNLL